MHGPGKDAPFSHHDRDRLSIGADLQEYFPASPLREPFHALLTRAPAIGRALVRDLANHATTAWRQLHRHMRRGRTHRSPLVLQFLWGRQEFWGAATHCVWSRGHGGPRAVECAPMARERRALEQLAAGHPASEVLQELRKAFGHGHPRTRGAGRLAGEGGIGVTLAGRQTAAVAPRAAR
jgi:hypothetical protein